jgi:hypothetical protein
MDPTLCLPDEEKSCFACCPPIRPADYEHLLYRNTVSRFLRENTRRFAREERQVRPITGFSCWALGYLDPGYRQIGCLLHPARNLGKDLRYRVDYWDKCSRETCPEAKVFSSLSTPERRFWLHLADGLDSFTYSSPRVNPLFPLLGWGSSLLSLIASVEGETPAGKDSFFQKYPFFTTSLSPRAGAYLINSLVDRERIHLLQDPGFREAFERLFVRVSDSYGAGTMNGTQGPPVHRIDLDRDFLDFLRLGLRISRIQPHEAVALKGRLDEFMEDFRISTLGCLVSPAPGEGR